MAIDPAQDRVTLLPEPTGPQVDDLPLPVSPLLLPLAPRSVDVGP